MFIHRRRGFETGTMPSAKARIRVIAGLYSRYVHLAIAGDQFGKKLTPIPISHTTWRDWRDKHSDTPVFMAHDIRVTG